ncbi:MAG: Gfo/Idh/MocA family oxidoreductase [Pirellulales bacterium]
MKNNISNRRRFLLSTSGALAATMASPYHLTASTAQQQKSRSANDRLRIGAIGMRYQGSVIADKARAHGDIVAICDVDRHIREQARASFGSTPKIYEHYHDLLARDDIDVVTIGTPDHWHTPMVVDACRAGKDVYVEKPLTLTIDEGKIIRRVVKETQRVVQVGSWQRSDHRFRLVVELVRQGRIGKLQRVDVVLGKNKVGGPFQSDDPPQELNWDLWLGQAPAAPYLHERCHYLFRWWYATAGGQMTDWGAHHIDIAQWAIDADPIAVRTQAKFPNIENGFTVAVDFHAEFDYPDGVVMTVSDTGRNGILFTGSEGRLFVNRATLSGKPIEDLKHDPMLPEAYKLYPHDNHQRPQRAGKLDAIVNHMGNFFDCVRNGNSPLSDAESQHRSATTCHLGNLSMRLGRDLNWDAEQEAFVDDVQADGWLSRQQRGGYEIKG